MSLLFSSGIDYVEGTSWHRRAGNELRLRVTAWDLLVKSPQSRLFLHAPVSSGHHALAYRAAIEFRVAQRGDALVHGRMAHQQLAQAVADSAADAERLHLRGKVLWP
jgi:hypothetical protein